MQKRFVKYVVAMVLLFTMAVSFLTPAMLAAPSDNDTGSSIPDSSSEAAPDTSDPASSSSFIATEEPAAPESEPPGEIEYLNELAWPDGQAVPFGLNLVTWVVNRTMSRATNPAARIYYARPGDDPNRYTNPASDYYYVDIPYVDGEMAFCVEPALTSQGGVTLPDVDPNDLFTFNQQARIAEIMFYTKQLGAESDVAMFFAGQVLIWEVANRAVSFTTLKHNGTFMALYDGAIAGRLETQYEAIKLAVLRHGLIPSFTVRMSNLVGQKEYTIPVSYFNDALVMGEISLEDKNGVVDVMDWPSDNPYFEFIVLDASHLKIKAKPDAVNMTEPFTLGPVMKTTANILEMLVVGDGLGGTQDIARCVVSADPVPAYMRLKLGGAPAQDFAKVDSESGFTIGTQNTPAAHYAAQVRVDSSPGGFMNGQTITLPYVFTTEGDYTLTEVHAPGFADPYLGYAAEGNTMHFTVDADGGEDWDGNALGGGTPSGDTQLTNTRQKGQVVIHKVDSDTEYINHWNVYRNLTDMTGKTITRTSADPAIHGQQVPLTDMIDSFEYNGEWFNNKTTVDNGLQSPMVNPKAQGDASLGGAVFEIKVSEQNGTALDGRKGIYLADGSIAKAETFSYDATSDAITFLGVNDLIAGAVVGYIRTDNEGIARSSYIDLGIYEVKEVKASKGYQLPDYVTSSDDCPVVVVDNYFTDETIPVNVHEFNYENDVIKGHIAFTKVIEGVVSNNPNSVGSQKPARDVYFGIYLDSKATAPRTAGDDVLDENGLLAGMYDADTQLPASFFVQRDLDTDAPISFNTGTQDANGWDIWVMIDADGNATTQSINPTDMYTYDQNQYNAYYKQLYMVLKTDSNGLASTRTLDSIVWCAIGGYSNGGGLLNDVGSSLVGGAMPLPYGTYTVVEYNPYEGYEAVKSVPVQIDERAAMQNSDGGYLTSGGARVLRRPELGVHSVTGAIEQNGLFGAEFDLMNNCYPYDFATDKPYSGDKENIVKDHIARQRIQVVKVNNESFTDTQAVAAYELAKENYREKLVQYFNAVLVYEEEIKTNPAAIPPVEPVKPLLEDFTTRGVLSDSALSGITVYTAQQLRDMGYTPTSQAKFLLWFWYNDSAAAGNNNYPGKRDYTKIGDAAYGEWIIQKLQGQPIGTFANPWVTDAAGGFEFQYPLVYGDYTLVEVQAPYGQWLPDGQNGLINDTIDNTAGVTQAQKDKYALDKAAYDAALTQYFTDLANYHTALNALANTKAARSYQELAALTQLEWKGQTWVKPVPPVEPIRPGHTGNNTDIEDVIKDEDGNPQPWIIDPGTGDWYVDEHGNTYAPKTDISLFTVSAADFPQNISDVYVYNKFVSVYVNNENQKGYVELHKDGLQLVGSETKQYTVNGKTYTELRPVFEDRPIAGAEYKVYAAADIVTPDQTKRYTAGELVATITTDSRGAAVSAPLYLGEYNIVETKAPYGYIRDEKAYSFTLEYKGQNVRVYPERQWYYNIRQNVEFTVLKSREQAGGGLHATNLGQSAWLPANGVVFGVYAKEDILACDGTLAIPAGSLVEHIVIAAGKGASTLDYPLGKYYLKELDTNEDLQLDPAEYDIEFTYTADGSGKGETVIEVKQGNGVTIKNYLKRGNVEILKTDKDFPSGATAVYLAGAEFTLYDSLGAARGVLVTGADGKATLGNIPYGVYTMKETKAPEGYKLNPGAWQVDINAHGTTLTYDITDEVDSPTVKIKKVDPSGNVLSGAVFEILVCDNPAAVQGYRAAQAVYMAELEQYTVAYAAYEEQLKTLPAGTPAPVAPVAPGKPQEVAPVWRLYSGAAGNLPYRYVTNASGSFTSDALEDGLYRLVEISAPVGYSGAVDVEFTIDAATMARPRIVSIEAVNFKNPEEPGVFYGRAEFSFKGSRGKGWPRTGDEENQGEITETETLVTSGAEPASHNFSSTITKDGKTYTLQNVTYSLVSEPLSESKTFTALPSKEVPKSIEVERNGKKYTLPLTDIAYTDTAVPVDVEYDEDLGYMLAEPKYPESKTITVDEKDVEVKLISVEQAEGYAWRPVVIDGRFYGQAGIAGFVFGDTVIPYNADAPVYQGYEAAILEYLGLPAKQYRITGARWVDADFILDKNGEGVRRASILAEQYTARWVAHYGAVTEGEAQYSAVATYSIGEAGQYEYLATATYTPAPAGISPVVYVLVGVLLILILIVVILLIISKKRKQREE